MAPDAWIKLAMVDDEQVRLHRIDLSDLVANGSIDALTYDQLLQLPRVKAVLPNAYINRPFGLAVFGQRRRLEQKVQLGDRVEILPSLRVDPKQARYERVAARRRDQAHDRWRTARAVRLPINSDKCC